MTGGQARRPADPAGAAGLPPARTPGSYRIELVCLGNICRSPMASVVLESLVHSRGLGGKVQVTSSGTGHWHVGLPMDERAARTLTAAGYDASRHRARQFDPARLDDLDLVLAMDRQNLADVRAAAPDRAEDGRVRLFGAFDPRDPRAEVPDPYYGGADGFEEVLTLVQRTAETLVAALRTASPWETVSR